MANQGNRKDREFELKLRKVQFYEQIVLLFRYAVKMTPWVFGIWAAVEIVRASVGESTELVINLFVDIWSGIDLGCKSAWAIAILALIYGWAERKFRQRKTAYFQERIRKFEEQEDPNRTSSGLTPQGKTPTEK